MNMKKILLLTIMLTMLLSFTSCSADSKGFKYEENDSGITIARNGNTDDEVFDKITEFEIPESKKGKPVTKIGNGAFSYLSNLTSITIPYGVTEIGDSAFKGCSSLTSINIPDSVTKISNYAFCDCTNLTSINIPVGVTEIGSFAFAGCENLTKIEIPNGVTKINNYTFNYCKKLKSITIPDSVTEIGTSAFSLCENLTDIEIPNSVKKISFDGTFARCESLKQLTLPDDVVFVEPTLCAQYPFAYCECTVTYKGKKYSISGSPWGKDDLYDAVPRYKE